MELDYRLSRKVSTRKPQTAPAAPQHPRIEPGSRVENIYFRPGFPAVVLIRPQAARVHNAPAWRSNVHRQEVLNVTGEIARLQPVAAGHDLEGCTQKLVIFRVQKIRSHFIVCTLGGSMKSTDLAVRLWRGDDGQDIAEYAVMLAVILVIVIGTVRLIGGNANNVFSTVGSTISQQ
jgi:Flp pilus assembly pilin Flp